MQEADRTSNSPITLELEGVTLETALKLALEQLGLVYTIRDDGIVHVDNRDSDKNDKNIQNVQIYMLETIDSLRTDVNALRWEVAALRTGTPVTPLPQSGLFSCTFGTSVNTK